VESPKKSINPAWLYQHKIGLIFHVLDIFRIRLSTFQHAFDGITYVFKTQRNAWIHSIATIAVFILGIWAEISITGWALLIIAIGMVWTAEVMNTAIEVAVDLASPQKHPLAKISKDVAAAAVLISAVFALIIGILILGKPLLIKLYLLFMAIQ